VTLLEQTLAGHQSEELAWYDRRTARARVSWMVFAVDGSGISVLSISVQMMRAVEILFMYWNSIDLAGVV